MAKELKGGVRVEAAPWVKGKLIAGYYIEKEQLPAKDGKEGSMKYIFSLDPAGAGGANLIACWGTGSLDYTMKKATPGSCYRIICKGKEAVEGLDVPIWQFTILEAENNDEAVGWIAEYRKYVAGGGK